MRPFPSKDDVAMELIFHECGTDHDFPQTRLEATETETDRHGHIVNVNRVVCPRCGTVKVTRWHAPDPAVSPQSVLAIGSFERPEPADVPGLAHWVALVTDEQLTEFAAERGYPGGIPDGFALREIGGRILELPPLPAGHGDYRLRFHVGEAGCLLQIWPQPRGKPRARV